jgi:hypothetical protein
MKLRDFQFFGMRCENWSLSRSLLHRVRGGSTVHSRKQKQRQQGSKAQTGRNCNHTAPHRLEQQPKSERRQRLSDP